MSRWQFFVRYGLPLCVAFALGGVAMGGLVSIGVPQNLAKLVWGAIVIGVLVGWYMLRKKRSRG